jgi:hypothetical protein
VIGRAFTVTVYREAVADRKLYRVDLAALAGIKPDSLGRAAPPPPDGHDIERGHARPFWWLQTATTWLANRPGKGWRRGVRGG